MDLADAKEDADEAVDPVKFKKRDIGLEEKASDSADLA